VTQQTCKMPSWLDLSKVVSPCHSWNRVAACLYAKQSNVSATVRQIWERAKIRNK